MKNRRNETHMIKKDGLSLTQRKAIALMIADPDKKFGKIAKECNVSRAAFLMWRKDPVFVKEYNRQADIYLSSFMPAVDRAMVNRALKGDVAAANYLSKITGRIQNRVTHEIVSPFDEWMKRKELPEAEIEIIDESLESDAERSRRLRNEMSSWRNRAKEVGVDLLPTGRPTASALDEWKLEILKAESTHEFE